MNATVKHIIETRITYIENQEFDKLFKLVQETYIPKTTHDLAVVLEQAGLQPLQHMDFIPEGYYLNSTIESYTIPSHINKISYQSFAYSDLKSIVIPGTVKIIEDSAFEACDFLEQVVVEEGVEKIYPYSFFGCSDLNKIYLPKSITYIGDSALEGAPLESGVVYAGTVSEFKTIRNSDSVFRRSVVKNVQCNDGIIRREEYD